MVIPRLGRTSGSWKQGLLVSCRAGVAWDPPWTVHTSRTEQEAPDVIVDKQEPHLRGFRAVPGDRIFHA